MSLYLQLSAELARRGLLRYDRGAYAKKPKPAKGQGGLFDESKVSRAADGEFTGKGGGGGGGGGATQDDSYFHLENKPTWKKPTFAGNENISQGKLLDGLDALPGQQDLFQYAADSGERWITIGAHRNKDGEKKGGTPVKISGGKIVSGPKHLKGKTLKGLGKTKPHAELKRAIHKAHKEHGFDKQHIHDAIELVHGERSKLHNEREGAKEQARKLTGLTAGDISRLSNAGHDYSSGLKAGGVTGQKLAHFDEFAQEIARSHPELGLGDPDSGDDFSANLWDALSEGKVEAPAKHHQDTVDEAVQLLHQNARYQPVEEDAVPFRKARVNMLAIRFERAIRPGTKVGYCRNRCQCFFGRCECGCRQRQQPQRHQRQRSLAQQFEQQLARSR